MSTMLSHTWRTVTLPHAAGLGHRVDKDDPLGDPKRGHLARQVCLDLWLGQIVTRRGAHHASQGPLGPLLVWDSDNRRLQDLWMADNRVLQLDGGDPFAAA